MKKSAKIVAIISCLALIVACGVIICKMSVPKETAKKDVGALVDTIPNDEDFVKQTENTYTGTESSESVVMQPSATDKEVVAPKEDTASNFIQSSDTMPEGLEQLPGYIAFTESEYYLDDQNWAITEVGKSCKVYITGAYFVEIEWIYSDEDCYIWVYNISDHNDKLAAFGLAK